MRREWACFENVLSPEECEDIIALGLERARSPGTVGLKTFKVDPAVRQSDVAFITRPDPDFAAVFALLDYLVEEANETHFGVRYYRHGARKLQFTVYQGDDGRTDYYGPHEDGAFASGNGLTQRKLSVMLQLSDPESYAGGEFVMHQVSDPPPPETVSRQGSLLVFPSILRHEVRKVTQGTRYSLVAWYLGEPWR